MILHLVVSHHAILTELRIIIMLFINQSSRSYCSFLSLTQQFSGNGTRAFWFVLCSNRLKWTLQAEGVWGVHSHVCNSLCVCVCVWWEAYGTIGVNSCCSLTLRKAAKYCTVVHSVSWGGIGELRHRLLRAKAQAWQWRHNCKHNNGCLKEWRLGTEQNWF